MATLTPTADLREKYPDKIVVVEGLDQPCWVVERDAIADLCRDLRDDPEGAPEGEPFITEGAPVAGMLGLGLIAAACSLGGALALRKKKLDLMGLIAS